MDTGNKPAGTAGVPELSGLRKPQGAPQRGCRMRTLPGVRLLFPIVITKVRLCPGDREPAGRAVLRLSGQVRLIHANRSEINAQFYILSHPNYTALCGLS